MDFRLEEATIDGIHSAFRSGELTCRRLVELYMARIEAYDENGPELNSIITVNPNAPDEADGLDRSFEESGEFVGPLHGIPVLVKDQAETAGIRTTFGSVAFEGYVPEEDATAVRRLKEAGALILAKTNLPDFATSWLAYSSAGGETKNPYDLDRDPGGSSSGTGAAVAANLGAVGIGEDTGGSIRVPSSFDNLVGVRVTTDLISRKGMSPLVVFQDTAGPMTRTVKDAAVLLDVLVGYDPDDPFTAVATLARDAGSYASGLDEGSLRGARIGVLRDAFGANDDPDSRQVNGVVGEAIEAMRGAGAEIVNPVNLPDLLHFIGGHLPLPLAVPLRHRQVPLGRHLHRLQPRHDGGGRLRRHNQRPTGGDTGPGTGPDGPGVAGRGVVAATSDLRDALSGSSGGRRGGRGPVSRGPWGGPVGLGTAIVREN